MKSILSDKPSLFGHLSARTMRRLALALPLVSLTASLGVVGYEYSYRDRLARELRSANTRISQMTSERPPAHHDGDGD